MRHGIRRESVDRHSLSWVALLLLNSAGPLHAQIPATPSPEVRQQGEQQERLQREREEAQRSLLQPTPKAPPPPTLKALKPWPAEESPCLPVREVVLVGESSESFQWALDGLIGGPDPAIGRCLGVSGVNIAADRAEHAVFGRGYITSRILFKKQDLSRGQLTLTFLPGRIEVIRFAEPVATQSIHQPAIQK